MAAEFFFAVKSIGLSKLGGRKPCTLLQAAEHNKRETQAKLGFVSRIDPTRTRLNESLLGPDTASGVVKLAEQIAEAAGVDLTGLRKDHCQAVELLFSLPPNSQLEDGQYFKSCVCWVRKAFPASAILSADIHRDESSPHCHALLSPVVEGRMSGSELTSRSRLRLLTDSFFGLVAGPAGLQRPAARLVGKTKAAATASVLSHLEHTQDPILRSPLWQLALKGIERQPLPYLQALNIDPNVIRKELLSN